MLAGRYLEGMHGSIVVVTGLVHVEGGETNSVRQISVRQKGSVEVEDAEKIPIAHEMIQIAQSRKITPDRRAANVISTDYMRRLRKIRLARTPYGSLVDRRRLREVKELIENAARDVMQFNREHENARLVNTLLWELLHGNRAAAMEGWLVAEVRRDSSVRVILDWLRGKALPEAAA